MAIALLSPRVLPLPECAAYHLLQYLPAEIAGGSLLAAWKFGKSPADYGVFMHVAQVCSSTYDRLNACAEDLIGYYQGCFPDAAKTYEQVHGSDCSEEPVKRQMEVVEPTRVASLTQEVAPAQALTQLCSHASSLIPIVPGSDHGNHANVLARGPSPELGLAPILCEDSILTTDPKRLDTGTPTSVLVDMHAQ